MHFKGWGNCQASKTGIVDYQTPSLRLIDFGFIFPHVSTEIPSLWDPCTKQTHETERQNRCEIKANKHGSQQGTHYIANIQGKLTYLTLELCEERPGHGWAVIIMAAPPQLTETWRPPWDQGKGKAISWTQGKSDGCLLLGFCLVPLCSSVPMCGFCKLTAASFLLIVF